MLSCTLQEYKNSYEANLSAYLEEYFENTKSFFLEEELLKYQNYLDSLTSIIKHFKNFTINEMTNCQIYSGVASELKKTDENIYYDIVIEHKKDGVEVDFNNLTDDELKKDLITIDFIKLRNYIKSGKLILQFISVEISTSKSELPQESTKQRDLTLEKEIVVTKTDTSDISKIPVNPYPRIFTSYYAFSFFEKLLAEFGVKKKYLSNYSFVYHKMVKDELIYHDIKQIEYFDFLAIYDIHISRIKGLNGMGNTQLRESIYTNVKESHKIVT